MTRASLPPLPFRRERLLAVGALAFLVPIPLFFTNALELPPLLAYLGLLALLLLRFRRRATAPLSNTALNLAALGYAPLLLLDLKLLSRSLLSTMLHLLLFTLVLKLLAVRRERDFSTVLILVGFLFVASVSTSFHYSIVVYVVGFAVLAWRFLVRWSLWRDLSASPEEWERDRDAGRLPGAGPLATSVGAAVLLAIPFFLLLPRLKAPYVRGVAAGREITTGFSETVDPDAFGRLKRSEKVFLRVELGRPVRPGDAVYLRFRTLALTHYDGRVWRRQLRGTRRLAGGVDSMIGLAERVTGRPAGEMEVDVLPISSRYLPYPLDGIWLRLSETNLRSPGSTLIERDDSRNLSLPFEPERTLHYTASLAALPPADLLPGDEADVGQAVGSPELRDFALRAMAGVDPLLQPEEAARRLERVLKETGGFQYSLDLVPAGPHPVAEFLFERKKGHCQVFATAMAVLLREAGIPSRFVSGFAGGEIGPFGRYVIVRGESIHAWVEAWCGPSRGWVTFDPTPAAGIPGLAPAPLSRRLRQLADGLEFLYDRYILSFGQSDQFDLLRKVHDAFDIVADAARSVGVRVSGTVSLLLDHRPAALARHLLLLLVLALLVVLVLRFRGGASGTRGLPPAAVAYRRLQRTLARRGTPLTPASAPAQTLEAAWRFGAEAAGLAHEIVRTYVAESFGGVLPRPDEAKRLKELLESVRRILRRGGTGEPGAGSPGR